MMKKSLIGLVLGMAVLQSTSFAAGQAEPIQLVDPSIPRAPAAALPPEAVVLSVHRKCDYSEDGKTFTNLKAGHVFNQGAIVRTGEAGVVDLFFRRIGTTVRLQPDTEVKLETMARHMKEGVPVLETLLDLRKGRIFTVVRVLVPGSTFEIRNAAGRSVVEGAGTGRYIITADGTQVADKSSLIPLKVVNDTGITVINPGQQFNAKEGKMFAAAPPETVVQFIDLDDLQSLSEQLTFPSAPGDFPKARSTSEALVLSVDGPSSYSDGNRDFGRLRIGQVLTQGAVIQTGENTVADLFLRRLGTTVRLTPNTELRFEKMGKYPSEQVLVMETVLHLRKGRIFCFVRLPIAESIFEIRTAIGRSVLNGVGTGRYDIRADGTVVAGKSSLNPLKVFTEHGVTLVVPGQKFSAENGDLVPIAPSELEMQVIHLDELQALAERLMPN